MPNAKDANQAGEKVLGIVIAGAAARGAYAAGALANLAPRIKEYERVVIVGTSSGAVNAALLAQSAHEESPADIAANLTSAWEQIDFSKVFRPIVAPRTLTRTAGWLWSRRVTKIFDTAPLHRTAQNLYCPKQVVANIKNGYPEAVAVVATLCQQDGTGGRSRVFLHSNSPAPKVAPNCALDYVPTPLHYKHVIASSAIPVLFPPERIDTQGAAGFYIDGGVRLNTPIKPALDLGATELMIISSHATTYPPPPVGPPGRMPDIQGVGAQSLNAVLGDAMIEDIRNLRRINCFVKAAGNKAISPNGNPYRHTRFLLVSPNSGQLAGMAATAFRNRYQGLFPLQAAFSFLNIGGDDRELLSFLLFDPHYMRDQIQLGKADASVALWQK
ncbi:patatin-like phospholipase family protein [Parafrankia sp. FMc2]|uniref:patatin-like phospholipase family protein n=1 Tax=Parafrankia sp. FMc2 TaxID=3233196 RepID=UPI0034D3CE33